MGIIRTIKLFAWEPYILKQMYQRRDEELKKIWLTRTLEISMNFASAMLPVFAKVVVIAIYVSVSRWRETFEYFVMCVQCPPSAVLFRHLFQRAN